MKQENVTELLAFFEKNGIEVVIDGGWGVDALLGGQTRKHGDLDIAVERKDLVRLKKLLNDHGYKHEPRKDDQEHMFVMADGYGHTIDIHAYEFDELGNNVWGIKYPRQSLQGEGTIGGKAVKCIVPEWVVKFHCNYEPTQKDIDEVRLICKKFNLQIPDKYQKLLV